MIVDATRVIPRSKLYTSSLLSTRRERDALYMPNLTPELILHFVSLLINAGQLRLYLPLYYLLSDIQNKTKLELMAFYASALAICLNIVGFVKKIVLILAMIPFFQSHQADALYQIADRFLIIYFFAIYLPALFLYLRPLKQMRSDSK